MAQDFNEEDEIRDVTRRSNSALRKTVRFLRRKQERIQAEADATIATLFDAPSEAEAAFGELWGNALFDCGPEDYEYMVTEIIKTYRLVEAQASAETQRIQGVECTSCEDGTSHNHIKAKVIPFQRPVPKA